MGDDKEDMDAKIRHVLRKQRNGLIPFHPNGKLICPFCSRNIDNSFNSMLSHTIGVGRGSRKRSGKCKAEHAAYGKFLRRYVNEQ